jgi:hypothetical protein
MQSLFQEQALQHYSTTAYPAVNCVDFQKLRFCGYFKMMISMGLCEIADEIFQ